MIRSMTGFGAGSATFGADELTVEIRSVNARYSEVRVRMPREFSALEPALVRQIKERIVRGNVDATVRRVHAQGSAFEPRIDFALADRVVEELRTLQSRLGLAGELRISDLLGVEGLLRLEERDTDLEEAGRALEKATAQALDRLLEMREHEGRSLRDDIAARFDRLEALRAQVETSAPRGIAARQERTRARVEEILEGRAVDPQRMAQELAILAERMDVSEELTRLASHLEQGRRLLSADEPAGRRLDFLVQEMNREANTIASKASWMDSAELVVEMKAEIERIREQVQNVE
jgi:uncharacterized protein (TIGR00255 family)